MVVLGGGAVSYERGTPVRQAREGAGQAAVEGGKPGRAHQVSAREMLCALRHSLSADLSSGAPGDRSADIFGKGCHLLLAKMVYTTCRRILPRDTAISWAKLYRDGDSASQGYPDQLWLVSSRAGDSRDAGVESCVLC